MSYTVQQCDDVLEKLREGLMAVAGTGLFQVQMPDGVFYTYTNPDRLNKAILFWQRQRSLALERSGNYKRSRAIVCG